MIRQVTLGPGETLPPGESCVVIVKTADRDFEVVASLFPAGTVSTLGTAPAIESAIAIAQKGAADLNLGVIYTVGDIQTKHNGAFLRQPSQG